MLKKEFLSKTLFIIFLNYILIDLTLCGIRIAQPDELSNIFLNSDIEAVYGDFGQIDLGFEAVGSIWIMPRDLTSKTDLPSDYACKPLTNIKILKDNYNFADFNIVLVEKGPCSYPQMAKEAENIGADMVIIVNDQPGSVSKFKVTNDDGRGHEVSIPVALISYNDGKAIIDYIISHPKENVYLSVEIGLNQRKTVKVDLFTNIQDFDTFTFLGKFKSYYELLGNYIDMNIYYLTPKFDGLLYTQKIQDCLKNGLYCLKGNLDSNNLSKKRVSGLDLIYESLFHQCIFTKSKKSYFNFIEQYSNMCINTQLYGDFCGLSLFNKGMKEIIMDCVFNSFGNHDYTSKWERPEVIKSKLAGINDNVNTILVNNRLKENQFKVNSYPDIYINDIKYTERLTSMYLFDAICDAFSQKPKPCLEYSARPTSLDEEGIPWYEIVLIILFLVFINAIIFWFVKKQIINRIKNRIDVDKNDLSGEINSVINSYFSLREMESRNSSDDKPTNDLGDVQKFMDDEDNENPDHPKSQPGSQLIMTNSVSLDNSDGK
jgi:hypothetical protein